MGFRPSEKQERIVKVVLQITRFEAIDGSLFETEVECVFHDRYVARRNAIKVSDDWSETTTVISGDGPDLSPWLDRR